MHKALKKRPEERYGTADALADDIERHLVRRPVLAQPDSARYRMPRCSSGAQPPVSVEAAIVVAVVTGTARRCGRRASPAPSAAAEQVKEFIVSIMRDADPHTGKAGEVDAADLLHAARARVDRELAGQPRVRLELLTIIGESYYGRRDNAEAAEVLEQALHEAMEAPDTDAGLVVHLRRLLSQTYAYLGRHADARRELRVVLGAYQSGARRDEDLIEARLNEARLAYWDAKHPEALAAAGEALRLADETPGAPAHARFRAHELSAAVYQAQERLDLAVQNYERAYQLAVTAHGKRAAPSTRAGSSGRLCEHARDGWPSARGAVPARRRS